MTPITGPFDRLQSDQKGTFYKYRRSYRQKKPYNLPLPFDSYGGKTLKASNADDWYGTTAWGATCNPAWMRAGFPNGEGAEGTKQFLQLIQSTQSTCRERFNSKLRSSAEMGAALYEARKSVDMITNRAGQLLRFARALRRFDFVGAGREIGQVVYQKERQYYRRTNRGPKPLRLRRNARAFGANYLEYAFGWAPLVGDIGNSIEIIGSPDVGHVNLRARANSADSYANQVNTYYPWAPVIDAASHKTNVIVTCKANVKVVNPNVALAAQLGLVNPVAIGWEVVPFSFIVDYFVNVQSYLENYTSTLGLELSDVSSTTYVTDVCTATQSWWDGRPGRVCVSDYYRHTRTNSLPEVSLRFKKVTLPVGRALTSISLLLSLGINKK